MLIAGRFVYYCRQSRLVVVWLWAFLLVFGIFMMYVSPYVIEPLFFKFEPVKAEGLEEKIRILWMQAGLKVSRVFQVDASRRSRHSNAYFTGIGKSSGSCCSIPSSIRCPRRRSFPCSRMKSAIGRSIMF